jgi:hypothetical protein
MGGKKKKDEPAPAAGPPGGVLVVSDSFNYELRDSEGRLKSFQGKKLKSKNRVIELVKRLLGRARV